ncbi:MAG TPA: DUF3011 domain-containing protein [Thermoanaerobaculales bacterium]|nr:DUF3011 domain-containing protein [Thermoanaerobaculales bacterium]HPA80317.1 DUF3011 domain-containing protein [Thermoanaerobaculales bacterium]HQL29504.1 DUF3011 domain-containing protein [Thermoanaerobaculales bacterium]HQN95147.1 DUF3011 domain-containing protein [Thermoanaerobaculales bacterium]
MGVLFRSLNRPVRAAVIATMTAALAAAAAAVAQDQSPAGSVTTAAGAPIPTVTCSSQPGERRHCPADTSAGVLLARTTGTAACLLGKSWGYDDAGIWVMDGCGGEFVVSQAAPQVVPAPAAVPAAAPPEAEPAATPVPPAPAAAAPVKTQPARRIETWGEFDPGDGFLVGRSDAGELSISAYALLRYMNQLPEGETFTDHLGNEHPVDTRQDFFPHRVMIFFKGWVGNPKLIYNLFVWTVNATDQDALFASMGYQFSRKFSLYGGINGLPGTRSLQGSHPYWLGHDRVMADEFFRPYFGYGIWAQGESSRGLWYNVQVGNNSSSLGIKAVQLDRDLSYGGSVWWMPTTHEFGPRGAYGDWEWHEEVATRFGVSASYSPEERFTDANTGASGNTTIRLADSLNVFDTGALAPGVTVQNVDYQLLSVDAGLKYRGIFLQTELYSRRLDNFVADGALPVGAIEDQGFYVQAAFYPWREKLELYAATSQIFGDSDAGFDDSSEYLVGANFYPLDTRNHRLNLQVMDVNHSPVSSTFGYYVGGQDGTTVSAAFSVFF